MQGGGVFDDVGIVELQFYLQDPDSGVIYDDINLRDDVHYSSADIHLPENSVHLRDLLNMLLRLAAPVIKEHWLTLPANKQQGLLACLDLDLADEA
jgi:hypothetical protein